MVSYLTRRKNESTHKWAIDIPHVCRKTCQTVKIPLYRWCAKYFLRLAISVSPWVELYSWRTSTEYSQSPFHFPTSSSTSPSSVFQSTNALCTNLFHPASSFTPSIPSVPLVPFTLLEAGAEARGEATRHMRCENLDLTRFSRSNNVSTRVVRPRTAIPLGVDSVRPVLTLWTTSTIQRKVSDIRGKKRKITQQTYRGSIGGLDERAR